MIINLTTVEISIAVSAIKAEAVRQHKLASSECFSNARAAMMDARDEAVELARKLASAGQLPLSNGGEEFDWME